MSDLISRKEAIEAMEKSEWGYLWECEQVINVVKALPSAEPERKKGKWVWEKKIPFERCRCSECGYCRQLKFPEPDYFCPNCGAEMLSGEEKDE